MGKGYVYVLSNSSMPGILKIGRSVNGGKKRAVDLYQTGVPVPFSLEFEVLVGDAHSVEIAVHQRLASQRVNGGREFFRVDVEEAIEAISAEHLAWLNLRVISEEEGIAIDGVNDIAKRLNIPAMPEVYDLFSAIQFIELESVKRAIEVFKSGIGMGDKKNGAN